MYTILSINFIFLKLEFQNLNVRSTTETVLRITKKKLKARGFFGQALLRKLPGPACNFIAVRLRMLISFLNDVDIQQILEFKNSSVIIINFLGQPIYFLKFVIIDV